MGVVFLVGAAVMAVASVITPILKNSLIWLLSFSNENAAEQAESFSPWGYILFWCLFAVCVAGAVYMAMLDMRYIRLKFAIEKRNMIREAMDDALSIKDTPKKPTPPTTD